MNLTLKDYKYHPANTRHVYRLEGIEGFWIGSKFSEEGKGYRKFTVVLQKSVQFAY